jgi:hypothetical protein
MMSLFTRKSRACSGTLSTRAMSSGIHMVCLFLAYLVGRDWSSDEATDPLFAVGEVQVRVLRCRDTDCTSDVDLIRLDEVPWGGGPPKLALLSDDSPVIAFNMWESDEARENGVDTWQIRVCEDPTCGSWVSPSWDRLTSDEYPSSPIPTTTTATSRGVIRVRPGRFSRPVMGSRVFCSITLPALRK